MIQIPQRNLTLTSLRYEEYRKTGSAKGGRSGDGQRKGTKRHKRDDKGKDKKKSDPKGETLLLRFIYLWMNG